MKLINFFAIVIAFAALTSCNKQGEVTKKSLDNEIDSVSYALGIDMAFKFTENFKEVNEDLFVQGFNNGMDSTDILIEKGQVETVLRTFFQKLQIEKQKEQEAEALKKAEAEFGDNKETGIQFLAENKSKDGVKTTNSGLQYTVIKEGTGEKPTATSKVKVHYHGTLLDGTVFDSSVDRGTPAEFGVNGVIKGWTEVLQLMPVGSKYKVFVPQELAYGAFPRQGGPIKPFSALVFDVELIEIVK